MVFCIPLRQVLIADTAQIHIVAISQYALIYLNRMEEALMVCENIANAAFVHVKLVLAARTDLNVNVVYHFPAVLTPQFSNRHGVIFP